MKREQIISILVKLMAIVVIGIGASFAWFSNFESTKVGGKITVDVDPFSSVSVNVNNIEVNDFTFQEECMSSDGTTFYTVQTDAGGHNITGYRQVTIGSQEYNIKVFDFDFVFTSYNSLSLYLGNESYVTPNDDTVNADRIAGAVRIAFLHTYVDQNDGITKTDRVIWAPNMNYQYDSGTGLVNKSGTVENYLQFVNGTSLSSVVQIPTSGTSQGFNSVYGFIWGTPKEDAAANIPIFTVTSNTRSTVTVTCRIWIEGTDREAVAALMGGAFLAHFNFIVLDN